MKVCNEEQFSQVTAGAGFLNYSRCLLTDSLKTLNFNKRRVMRSGDDLYRQASVKAGEIETELKKLSRWDSHPLSPEKFENMGAFGSNTMTFEQWLQFILLPRIQEIVREHGEFPDSSELAPYAIRYFDGDPQADGLHQLLYDLDALINRETSDPAREEPLQRRHQPDGVYLGDTSIPPVMFTLADLLPQFDGDPLESQLQTFDSFLSVLSPTLRPFISNLILQAASKTSNALSRERLEKAAKDVEAGSPAAEPYNHEEAMRKYQEEFRKSYRQ